MWEWIVYGFAIYGLVSLWVQLFSNVYWWKKSERQSIHFIIFLQNSQRNVEWIYRSLEKMSHVTGKNVHITFIDFGSKDDTLLILRKLTRGKFGISIQEVREFTQEWFYEFQHTFTDQEHPVFIDLRKQTVQSSASA